MRRTRHLTGRTFGASMALDASKASSLFDATSGGNPVAADGYIRRWEDLSGNARHAVQINALPAIRKVAARGGLDVARAPGTVGNGFSVATVPTTSSNATVVMVHHITDTQGIVLNNTAGNYSWVYSSGSSSTGTSQNWGTPTARKNGAAQSWANRGAIYTAFVNNTAVIATESANFSAWGSPMEINNYGSFEAAGDFGEIEIYGTALTSFVRKRREDSLMRKWRITQ